MMKHLRHFAIYSILSCLTTMTALADEPDVDFNRDVRPILSDKCFACHGPDAENQESEFRLDSSENATADLGGYFGIVPGKPDESDLIDRIESDDMPPPDSNRTLSDDQKKTLKTWIQQGAKYDKHWSFVPPERPELPKLNDAHRDWVRNPIDSFVAARLESEKLSPATEASLELRLRRASLTLTGLLPTPKAMDAALAASGDSGPEKAYEQFVDQLLDSTDYAERQALRWLDAARFADTDGYQNDFGRQNWPWRDWVIQAYQQNMPFDQFTIEQLAGDMLPNADPQQILASAFNRNHRQNSEGGALADEFFVENVIDRVETTSTVWLGLTMGCARCHDHKFDPLSQREFFQMFAYFNNIGESGFGKGVDANPTANYRSPLIDVPKEIEDELSAAKQNLAAAKIGLADRADAWAEKTQAERVDDQGDDLWVAADVRSAEADNGAELTKLEDGTWLAGGKKTTNTDYTLVLEIDGRITGLSIDAMSHESLSKPRQLAPSSNGNFVLSEVSVSATEANSNTPVEVALEKAEATFAQSKYPAKHVLDGRPETGWAVYGPKPAELPSPVSLYLTFAKPLQLSEGSTITVQLQHQSQFSDHHIGRLQVNFTRQQPPHLPTITKLPANVMTALNVASAERNAGQTKTLREYFEGIDPVLIAAHDQVKSVKEKTEKLVGKEVPVMVMREKQGEPMPAYLLERGQYDQPDKSAVLPRGVAVALLPDADEKNQPRDRLELARWIVSRDNPLTARVIVNRVWQDHFGIGLVKTVEDFGSQGEFPSHPELLDWLAVEFMESQWDVKSLHRLIVTSATYRQSSAVTKELYSRDPQNRLIARGPRHRMDGFSIRDNALKAARLLDERIGGPPVKPYQPEGLWAVVAANKGTSYGVSKGRDLYRKSMYSYWKRAVNPPRQLIFDSGGREACNVYVRRTNTPLQALVLMNDETFVEAARNVAMRVLDEIDAEGETEGETAEKTDEVNARIDRMYRLCTARQPTEQRLKVLNETLAYFTKHYADNPKDAESLLQIGAAPYESSRTASKDAAWTAVAHLILNLDETITVE